MENNMITYSKDEMVGITELGKSLGSYLDKVTSDVLSKIAIIRRNKPEAVIIPIEEYELLQSAYDRLEQQEIEMLLKNMTDEEKEVASTKVLSIDINKTLLESLVSRINVDNLHNEIDTGKAVGNEEW